MTHAPAGMPRNAPRMRNESEFGRPLIQVPPMTRNRVAMKMYMAPSVAMIGGVRV